MLIQGHIQDHAGVFRNLDAPSHGRPGERALALGRERTRQGQPSRRSHQRGVDSGRLVFARRQSSPEHLARHRLADLFLDTLPYNAHTTASDALWAGPPVLTCAGDTFAGRVAGSLLQAVGLPELVTFSPSAHESIGLRLARRARAFAKPAA